MSKPRGRPAAAPLPPPRFGGGADRCAEAEASLREATRAAHEATKDLRAVTAEARAAIALLADVGKIIVPDVEYTVAHEVAAKASEIIRVTEQQMAESMRDVRHMIERTRAGMAPLIEQMTGRPLRE